MEPSAFISSDQEKLPHAFPAQGDEPASNPFPQAKSKKSPERFDFRQPSFLPAAEMRNLSRHHAEFIEALAASLANYLRTEVLLDTVKVRTMAYRDYVSSVRTPAHLTLLKLEPLRGVCIVDIPPKLGLAMVDRLLGGPGTACEEIRELSEIETALLDQVVQLLMTDWCSTWDKGKDIRPLALAHENSGQFLKSSPPETTMLVLGIETRLGECIELIQAVFPWPTVEPLFDQLAPKLLPDNPAQLRGSTLPKWRSEFAEIPLNITVHGPVVEIAARDLARLKPGDMISLDPQFVNQISVHVGNIAKFTGRLGTSGAKWAVELTAIQNPL